MDGWIVKNSKGQYLVKSSQWRPHKNPEGMFFSEQDLEELRKKAKEEGIDLSSLSFIPARFEGGKISLPNGWTRRN